jgi:hypothetical protein
VRVASEKTDLGSSATTEVARVSSPGTGSASRGAPVPEAFEVARASVGRAVRPASNKQVQVESVNFPRSAVSMWSEPASDTTVIWIDDEEQAAGRR